MTRTITSEEWDWLKLLLANEVIPQTWFLARCKAVRPSEIFFSQGRELMDRLREIGTEYRLESGNGRSNDAQRPTAETAILSSVPPWYAEPA